MVGCDQATGREAPKPRRLRLDLQMTTEPQPELIHTRWGSRTRTRKAQTSGSQRNLFTSPGRTRKNKGLSKHSAARLQYHWDYQIIKKFLSSSLRGGIYTTRSL